MSNDFADMAEELAAAAEAFIPQLEPLYVASAKVGAKAVLVFIDELGKNSILNEAQRVDLACAWLGGMRSSSGK